MTQKPIEQLIAEGTVYLKVPFDRFDPPKFLLIELDDQTQVERAKWPIGKGMFIWNRSRCANNSPSGLAAACVGAGFKWVTIKAAERKSPFNGDLSAHIAALRDNGVSVWGWQYVYGDEPLAEADIAISRMNEFDFDGWMIDVEGEYKGKLRQAELYSQRLRDGLDDSKGIGLCSFRYPTLHATVPWQQFLRICTFHNPQVYWIGNTGLTAPGSQLARSMNELKTLKDIPVVPIGLACDHPFGNPPVNFRPSVTQLDNFHDTVKRLNLPSECWWSWEHVERIPEFWSAISRHQW